MRYACCRPPSFRFVCPTIYPSPVRLVLPALSDDHLLHIMSDIGVAAIPGMSSPSHLLSVIRANEAAQAAIAKALEAASGAGPAGVQGQSGVVGATNGCGQSSAPPARVKIDHSKRSKPYVAPCRSSLRIKNLSFK